ncbi:hypothetical protein BVI434_3950003 [Burkholderia vietnamiensis]|nr:hypothetical protein BVI434_3950003 [Burkholderia vietnamiensis]
MRAHRASRRRRYSPQFKRRTVGVVLVAGSVAAALAAGFA